jgi:hypothetical protein
MPTAIQLAAQTAIAAHGLDGNRNIHAVKATREATGCGLREAIDAVRWAIDNRPTSVADLPRDSLVASKHEVYIKGDMTGVDNWAKTGWITPLSDADIDDLLQSDEATVLRVGTGP